MKNRKTKAIKTALEKMRARTGVTRARVTRAEVTRTGVTRAGVVKASATVREGRVGARASVRVTARSVCGHGRLKGLVKGRCRV